MAKLKLSPFLKKVSSGIKKSKGKKRKAAVMKYVMRKFSKKQLHARGAGKKKGKPIKNKSQALAIAFNTAKRLGIKFAAIGLEAVHIPSTFKVRKKKRRKLILKRLKGGIDRKTS